MSHRIFGLFTVIPSDRLHLSVSKVVFHWSKIDEDTKHYINECRKFHFLIGIEKVGMRSNEIKRALGKRKWETTTVFSIYLESEMGSTRDGF